MRGPGQALGNSVKETLGFQNKQTPTPRSSRCCSAFSYLVGISGWLPQMQNKGHQSVMIMPNNNKWRR